MGGLLLRRKCLTQYCTCSKCESLPYAPHPIEIIIRMKGVLKELVIERERYRPTKAAPTMYQDVFYVRIFYEFMSLC